MNFIPGSGKMIVAEDTEFTLDDLDSKRNNNYLIVGASGTSKTRSIVIPNILKATGSYVISDPKGSLYKDYGPYLEERGYETYLLDFRNPYISSKYNPLDYVHNEDDALKLATILFGETNRDGKDKYWELSGIYLLASIICYTKFNLCEAFHNLSTVAEALETKKVKIEMCDAYKKFIEKKYDKASPADIQKIFYAAIRQGYDVDDMNGYFKVLQDVAPCAATRFYAQLFNEEADNTKDCIFMEAQFAMQQFATNSMRCLTKRSSFNFKEIGDSKTAIFVICSDTDRSKDTFVSLFYSQCLQELCNYADTECKGGRLPVPVRFFLDDFSTNYKIKDFDKIITMIRSRGISATVIVQDLNQLTTSYGGGGKTIINNCDNIVYLGGNDYLTYEEISKIMDKSIDEIRNLKYRECFVYRRLENTKKAVLLNLDSYKSHILNGCSYVSDIKLNEKPKNKVGFQMT